MDFEDSISSWIGKIHEGFDTFCSEAKDFLPKKPVQNVQEQLAKAAENLKQFRFDLDIFPFFELDSEHETGQKHDETEENVYHSHAKTKSSDEKKDVTESSENGCDFGEMDDEKDMIEVEDRTFRIGEPNSFESSPIIRDGTYLLGLTPTLKELELHHPPLMESFKFSDDDVHPWTAEDSSDAESETYNSHYYHWLEEKLRTEVIRDRFLSPLSGSVRSLASLPFEDTQKSSRSSDHEGTSSDDYTPRTITPVPDISECWSKFTPSPVVSSIQDYEEIMKEKEWESLDADFNDEDWEIV